MRNLRTLFRLITMVFALVLLVVIVRVYSKQLAGTAGHAFVDTLLSFGQLILLLGAPLALSFIVITGGLQLASRRQQSAEED